MAIRVFELGYAASKISNNQLNLIIYNYNLITYLNIISKWFLKCHKIAMMNLKNISNNIYKNVSNNFHKNISNKL